MCVFVGVHVCVCVCVHVCVCVYVCAYVCDCLSVFFVCAAGSAGPAGNAQCILGRRYLSREQHASTRKFLMSFRLAFSRPVLLASWLEWTKKTP